MHLDFKMGQYYFELGHFVIDHFWNGAILKFVTNMISVISNRVKNFKMAQFQKWSITKWPNCFKENNIGPFSNLYAYLVMWPISSTAILAASSRLPRTCSKNTTLDFGPYSVSSRNNLRFSNSNPLIFVMLSNTRYRQKTLEVKFSRALLDMQKVDPISGPVHWSLIMKSRNWPCHQHHHVT